MKTDSSSYIQNPCKLPTMSESPAGEPSALHLHCTTVVRGREKRPISQLILWSCQSPCRAHEISTVVRTRSGGELLALATFVWTAMHVWLLMTSRVMLGSDSNRHLRRAQGIDVREDPFSQTRYEKRYPLSPSEPKAIFVVIVAVAVVR